MRDGWRYYHGGVPGLEPGERILPPAVTGVARLVIARPDRVYATPILGDAVVYAATYPLGDVYEVDLDDPIEPDGGDILAPDVAVHAPLALVTAVAVRRARPDQQMRDHVEAVIAALKPAPDLTGPERSEGPYVAPLTHTLERVLEPIEDAAQAYAGHTSCKSQVFGSPGAAPAADLGPAAALGRARYEGRRTA
jgi:hypothetical protein